MNEEAEKNETQQPLGGEESARQESVTTARESAPKSGGWLSKLLGGQVLQSQQVTRQIPLLVLICIYALMLVWMRYQVEDLSRAKIAAQERTNYLRETRIELQKHYQETIKISEIAEQLDSTGVGLTAGPPYEI